MKALIHFERDPNIPWSIETRRDTVLNLLFEAKEQSGDVEAAFAVALDFMRLQGHGEMTAPEFIEWLKSVAPPRSVH